MQEKSAEKCSSKERLDRLRVGLQVNWSEIAKLLNLSESMIYQVKSGAKELSQKALWRLAKAEREAGIGDFMEGSFAVAQVIKETPEAYGRESHRERNRRIAAELRRLADELDPPL
jgi:transcriptional regulator with XRE-family HTH domain